MSYNIIRGDLEPDMELTAAIDGTAESLTGALAYVLRWLKPDGTLSTVSVIGATRATLVIADDVVESVDATLDTLTLTAHAFLTGDGPVQLTTTGTLPAGLATATDYWVIKAGANTLSLSATLGGAAVGIADVGTGVHTIVDTASTQRADLSAGLVKRVWVATDTDLVGTHYGQLVVTKANGEDQTFPADGSHYLWFVYEQLGAC